MIAVNLLTQPKEAFNCASETGPKSNLVISPTNNIHT